MQMDEDVGKMAQATPILISKALEMFMQAIVDDVTKQARLTNTKRLMPAHLKRCVAEIECYDFLKDIVEKVVDDLPPGDGSAPLPSSSADKRKSVSGASGRDSQSTNTKKNAPKATALQPNNIGTSIADSSINVKSENSFNNDFVPRKEFDIPSSGIHNLPQNYNPNIHPMQSRLYNDMGSGLVDSGAVNSTVTVAPSMQYYNQDQSVNYQQKIPIAPLSKGQIFHSQQHQSSIHMQQQPYQYQQHYNQEKHQFHQQQQYNYSDPAVNSHPQLLPSFQQQPIMRSHYNSVPDNHSSNIGPSFQSQNMPVSNTSIQFMLNQPDHILNNKSPKSES
ncbi:DNA polymerase epsilon subunit C [Smittium culicis]|uniref:DNA polymerase epsilon subunit C n=1 Tax=Smittium culicis TaxID=133412 RepID=A0A1R1Y7W3_9FUNG|nr:DNA polymerase epsilon subunit C [Smittium culicis]